MKRAIHPKRFVTFVRDHVHVYPATTLEVHTFDGSGPQKIADIPEQRDEYVVGQVLTFNTVNAARNFVKNMCGAAVVGKHDVAAIERELNAPQAVAERVRRQRMTP